MRDAQCPYCGEWQEINHDDGYGYEEGQVYNQECSHCRKTFVYETHISFDYDVAEAPCLNGESHSMEPVKHVPYVWPDWKRCGWCGYEERGEVDKEAWREATDAK